MHTVIKTNNLSSKSFPKVSLIPVSQGKAKSCLAIVSISQTGKMRQESEGLIWGRWEDDFPFTCSDCRQSVLLLAFAFNSRVNIFELSTNAAHEITTSAIHSAA